MKRFFKIITLIATFSVCYAARQGIMIEETGTNPIIKRPLKYYIDEKSYTSGGVAFTYPTNLFSATPDVFVTIALSGLSYGSNLAVFPIITSSDATQVTVRVNKDPVGLGGLQEASSSDITVRIFAVEQ